MDKLERDKIVHDVTFIIAREMPDDVASVDIANVISDVQRYLRDAFTAEDEPVISDKNCWWFHDEMGWMSGCGWLFPLLPAPAWHDCPKCNKFIVLGQPKKVCNQIALRMIDEACKACADETGQAYVYAGDIIGWLQQEDSDG